MDILRNSRRSTLSFIVGFGRRSRITREEIVCYPTIRRGRK